MKLPLTYLFQPAKGDSRNLLVVLHGLGDSAEGLEWLQDELAIDSLNCLLLNAPTPYYTGFSWYDIEGDRLPGILKSRELLTNSLEKIAAAGFPPDRTYFAGFSQGCLMTLEFGSRYREPFAGYIGISGYCDDPEAILREMNPAVNRANWLVTHGTQDELLPVQRTRSQIQQLIAGGFRIDYREYRKAHTVDFEKELPEIREWLIQRITPC